MLEQLPVGRGAIPSKISIKLIDVDLRNNAVRYGLVSRLLHWGIALGIAAEITLGLSSASIGFGNPDRGKFLLREEFLYWHKSLGVTILAFMLMRLVWTFLSPPPPMPDHIRSTERALAWVAHKAFYVLIPVMAISGIALSQAAGFAVEWFGLLRVPSVIRPDLAQPVPLRPEVQWAAWFHTKVLLYLVCGVIALHLLGVAKHLLVDRDFSVWRRMAARKNDEVGVQAQSAKVPALAPAVNPRP
jgi:cytochrome b561